MDASLLTRIARGAGWVIAWRLGIRILGLISTLVLVRLLAPEDFGLIALATGFAQTIEGMMAIGADEAVIRERNPGRDIYDTAFTLNLLRGIAVAALVALPQARLKNSQQPWQHQALELGGIGAVRCVVEPAVVHAKA